jgi:hypothetical protein
MNRFFAVAAVCYCGLAVDRMKNHSLKIYTPPHLYSSSDSFFSIIFYFLSNHAFSRKGYFREKNGMYVLKIYKKRERDVWKL